MMLTAVDDGDAAADCPMQLLTAVDMRMQLLTAIDDGDAAADCC